MKRWDAIIVGAGPAGSAAAIELGRRGARVCVVDRATFPRAKTCGDAVSNRASRIVDELCGEDHAIATVPHAIFDRADAVFPDGQRIGREFGADHGYIVPRVDLDDLLRRQLESAGVEVREGVRVRRLLQSDGTITGVQAEAEAMQADAVIAADGPGSVGWAALGRPYERGRNLAVAITGYYEGVEMGELESTTEHYFESELRSGYAWSFPAVDGAANVGVYQRADAFDQNDRTLKQWLALFLERHPERFAHARLIGRTRVWALPVAVRVGPPGGPGLLLAGDAAYSIDPLSGEGIFQALHTGRSAARTVSAALQRGGLSRRWVAQYQLDWARHLGATSLVRFGVQEVMNHVVDRELYRSRWLKALLTRGYRSESLEVSKKLG